MSNPISTRLNIYVYDVSKIPIIYRVVFGPGIRDIGLGMPVVGIPVGLGKPLVRIFGLTCWTLCGLLGGTIALLTSKGFTII